MARRRVTRISKSIPTTEGAGVHLRRAFGFGKTGETDPFLLLDDFRNDEPDAYRAGFPWHPHRGIETITYVLAGSVEHGDSLGNAGSIGPGDVQWMTAGSGIIHQEMPAGDKKGHMHGFQLWANLPASKKMIPPRYQEFSAAEIPRAKSENGSRARIICGELWGVRGPVEGIGVDPAYFDIEVPPGVAEVIPIPADHTAFAYVIAGEGEFCDIDEPFDVPASGESWIDTEVSGSAGNHQLLLFSEGDEISVAGGEDGVRFLLVHGRPLKEPVAWYGPIVMNSQEELKKAFEELDQGTFLRNS